MSTTQLVKWIDGHSHDGGPLVLGIESDKLRVRDCYTDRDGAYHEVETTIAATLSAAKRWLNY